MFSLPFPLSAVPLSTESQIFQSVSLFDEVKTLQPSALPVCSCSEHKGEFAFALSFCPVFLMDGEFPATQRLRTKTTSPFLFSLCAGWGTEMCFSLFALFYNVSFCGGALLWGLLAVSSLSRLALP